MDITFASGWVRARDFEDLLAWHNPCESSDEHMYFRFPSRCALLIDTVLRTLSLVNQLASEGHEVTTAFEDQALFGYLDRMGFFTALHPNIEVLPHRPGVSAHSIYFGGNQELVEICVLNPGRAADAKMLPGALADRIAAVLGPSASGNREFGPEMFTVFSELIGNYFEHSESRLPGYVVAQTYARSNSVRVAISDSGLGITKTIRRDRPRDFRKLTEPELLLAVINEGVSRHGQGNGRSCGLHRCGQISLRYSADVILRTPGNQVYLRPGKTKYEKNMAHFRTDLGYMKGTHLCFEFSLDAD